MTIQGTNGPSASREKDEPPASRASSPLSPRLLLVFVGWLATVEGVTHVIAGPYESALLGLALGAAGAWFLQARGAQALADGTQRALEALAEPSSDVPVGLLPGEIEPLALALREARREAVGLRRRLEDEQTRQEGWTRLFPACSQALLSEPVGGERFTVLLETLCERAGFEAGGFYSLQDGELRDLAWRGVLPAFPPVALDEDPGFRGLALGRLRWIENLEGTPVDPVLREYASLRAFRCVVVVPAIWDAHLVGFLVLFAREPRVEEPSLCALLQALGSPLGAALVGFRNYERLMQRQHRREEALACIRVAGEPLEGPELAARLLERVGELQAFHRGALLVPEEGDAFLVHTAGPLGDTTPFLGSRLRREGSCVARAMETRTYHLDADLASNRTFREDRILAESGYRSRLVVPMLSGSRVAGCVYLVARDEGAFTPEGADELQGVLQVAGLVLDAGRRERSATAGRGAPLDPAVEERARRLDELSHELAGQLRGMIEVVGALGRGDAPSPTEKTREMAAQLRSLVARLEGAQEPERTLEDAESLVLEEVKVDEIVKDLAFNVTARLKARRLRLSPEVPEGLPAIVADPGHLRSALFHLLERAAENTPVGGRIGFRTACVRADASDAERARLMPPPMLKAIGRDTTVILFSVVDQGPILGAEERAMLESEAPADVSLPEQPQLELQFVKRLVALHRGHMGWEAGPGGTGNTLTLAFPQLGMDQLDFLHHVGRRLLRAREAGVPVSMVGLTFAEAASLRESLGDERFRQAVKELEGGIQRAVRGPADCARCYSDSGLVLILAETDRAGAARMVERVQGRLAHHVYPALQATAALAARVVCYPEDVVCAEDAFPRLVGREEPRATE